MTQANIKITVDGEIKVSQFVRSDGRLNGLGNDLIKRLFSLKRGRQLERFYNNLLKLSFYTNEEIDSIDNDIHNHDELSETTGGLIINMIVVGSIHKVLDRRSDWGLENMVEYFYHIDVKKTGANYYLSLAVYRPIFVDLRDPHNFKKELKLCCLFSDEYFEIGL